MTSMSNHPIMHDWSTVSLDQNPRAQEVSSLTCAATKVPTLQMPLFYFGLRQRWCECGAFSLIEVVLAIGVVAFALLGIVGLFSSSMKNNRESSAQQESFHAARMISSRMQDTNFFLPKSLGDIQSVLCPAGASKNYFLYTANDTIILTNSPSYGLTNGTLYCVQVLLSQNLATMTNAFPMAGGVTPSSSDWPNWQGLPLSVKVYSLPNASLTNTITNSVPVMTFDMVIPR